MARILIVEDNPANLELMRYLLQAFGHVVFAATDGEQGEASARHQTPDLVLCDLQLPGIDGFEVARRLKGNPELSSIPLLAVTAFAMVGDREKILAVGFDGYIPKPIDPETFVGQVEQFLGGASSRSAAPSQPHASVDALPHVSNPPPKRASILCVDDSSVNLSFLRSLLEPHGYEVNTATTVRDGLAQAKKKPPNLFLADVHMPLESGYDFLRAVKADPALAQIPFLFLTSTVAGRSDRELGLKLGARKFIVRPVEPEVVLAEIEDCLR
jgi:two-component system, cell cycle response regulator